MSVIVSMMTAVGFLKYSIDLQSKFDTVLCRCDDVCVRLQSSVFALQYCSSNSMNDRFPFDALMMCSVWIVIAHHITSKSGRKIGFGQSEMGQSEMDQTRPPRRK